MSQFSSWGMNRGVAGEAFSSYKVLTENDMDKQLRVKGEGRLKSMMSIPIESPKRCSGKSVVVLNVDSAVENAFPQKASEDPVINLRIGALVRLVQRINAINEDNSIDKPENPAQS